MDLTRLAYAVTTTFILGVTGISALAQNPPPSSDVTTWTSTSVDAAGFAEELSVLYLTLYNSGRLAVHPNITATSDDIERVLRENQNLVGPLFPKEIDSLACDLNANRCSRERTKVSTADWQLMLTNTITEFAPSRGHWTLKPGESLVLPSIRLQIVPRWVDTKVGPDRALEDIVTKDLGGCVQFDDACKSDILQHNRSSDRSIFERGYKGKLVLPVIAARAMLDISSAQESPFSATEWEPRPDASLILTPSSADDGTYKVKVYGVKTSQEPDNLRISKTTVVKTLQFNTLGTARIKLPFQLNRVSALMPSDFRSQQSDLSSLIDFPYRNLSEFPTAVRGANIAVFDTWIDPNHCAFGGSRFEIHNLGLDHPLPTGLSAGNCAELINTGEIDHGTHVAGVIGELLPSGQSFGLNPYSKLITYEVDFSDPDITGLANTIDQLAASNVAVANMSFGYSLDPTQGSRDPVLISIRNLRDSVLFVVAAGNYGTDFSDICDLRPTCFDLPNVVVVAGLNRDVSNPDLLRANGQVATNYGTHVHVGAIGENVFSTAAYGRFGLMSGSSSAAPQVAAVASMLMQRYRRITPQEAKNRLIYCSDDIGHLDEELFGGRLNASCTLDGDTAALRLKTTPLGGPPLRGYFQSGQIAHFKDAQSGQEFLLPLEGIRGIQLNPQRNTYTVYFNSDRNHRDSRLYRGGNLVPEQPVDTITFSPTDGQTTAIKLNDIIKYASAVN